MPSTTLGPLNLLIASNIKNSLAPKTWDSYLAAWRDWLHFCSIINIPFLQADSSHILAYVAISMSKCFSFSRISKSLAGISFFLKLHGSAPLNQDFMVKQSLKGYKKSTFRPDSRRPITLDILGKLFFAIPHICISDFESSLFRAAFLLAFFAALRIGEIVAPNKSSDSFLRFSDIIIGNDFIKIFISRSKTDQLAKGAWIQLFPNLGSLICPVLAISHYASLRPSGPGSFFIHSDGTPLSRFQFIAVLKKCLVFLNLGHIRFTSHSFRIGAATEAARLGLDNHLIKKIGRWESSRFNLYIRPDMIVSA